MSLDVETVGSIRVIPFEVRNGKWKLYPTLVVDKIIAVPGVLPLRGDPRVEQKEMRCDSAWQTLYSNHGMTEYVRAETLADSEDTDETHAAQGTDAEVQDIIGRLTNAAGTYWYEVTWKGYDFEDTTWHKVSDLQSCKKHVAAYDAWLLARGEDQLEKVYA